MNTAPSELQYIKGVGEKKARLFNKLGVFAPADLVNLYPRGYMDLSSPKAVTETVLGEKCAILACVTKAPKLIKRIKGMEIYKGAASDESGVCELVFFNNKYSALSLNVGEWYFFYGTVNGNLLKRELVNPYTQRADGRQSAGLIPLYPLTTGLSQKAVRSAVLGALEITDFQSGDILPHSLRMKYALADREYSLRMIHNPKNEAELSIAKKRLVFEEMLIFNTALHALKQKQRKDKAPKISLGIDAKPFYDALGFKPTNAQQRAINDCINDMRSGYCMNRLIQGDVGCGKTAVACAIMFIAAKNACQSAFMAPTEVLANQHFYDLEKLFSPLGIKVGLLTGSMTVKQKREALEKIQSGEFDIVVGTHALISDSVNFKNLALCITDEQHRFGVTQRETLHKKGDHPHMLIMSATPIPRTLAMVLYAELDISVIDELPPGRKAVKTYAVGKDLRERLYGFVKKNILEGRQAYIICAKAQDDEKSDLVSVKELTEELQNGYLKGINIAYIHGKMAQKQKDEIMNSFASGKLQALVSTTVVEVGVNVPNATVMAIENAERFGLSSLHQLRGRVGRGAEQAYCILISDSEGENASSRLNIMTKTNDGFLISKKDLEIRGPGEFFGQRQSGLVRFKIANLMTDMQAITLSQECAKEILEADPKLLLPEHQPLKRAVKEILSKYIT